MLFIIENWILSLMSYYMISQQTF